MLRSRIIPCLLLHNKGLVKTVKFKDPKYVGDPINTVKIFNEKEADELIVLDIDATVENREPDYALIEKLAIECRMPLCYGGGIKTAEQAARIVQLGVEKVAVSSAAIERPELISEIAEAVGSQSVVVVLDVKRKMLGDFELRTHRGTKKSRMKPTEMAQLAEEKGAGEILLNSIDREGTFSGYDLEQAEKIRAAIALPLTILGGAGQPEHIRHLINRLGTAGAGAGSLFVFKGNLRAVLINYPQIDLFSNHAEAR